MQVVQDCVTDADFSELEGPSFELVSDDSDIIGAGLDAALDPDHEGVRTGSTLGSIVGGLLAKATLPGTTAIGAALGAHLGGKVEKFFRSLGEEEIESSDHSPVDAEHKVAA